MSDPTHGYVAFVNAPGIAITNFTEADPASGNVIFVHDGSATTEATFKVSVSDGASSSGPTTIHAIVPTVSIVVKTANGKNFQNEDTITALGAGVFQPNGTTTTFTLKRCCKPRFCLRRNRFLNGPDAVTAGVLCHSRTDA